MAQRRIVLKASDVAAIIGRHTYKPRQEILDEYWKKISPETFTGRTKKDRALAALGASDDARKVLASAVAHHAADSTDVQKVFEAARDAINLDSKLDATQKSEVIEHIRSKVYTTHGTRTEDHTSTKVATETNVVMHRDNKLYTLEIGTWGEFEFVIGGRIDRIEEAPDGSRTLIEIKNRANRLFRRVVEYELIQVQVYLQMLGLVHARLVEQYNNQVMQHTIDRDEELWQNVIRPGLEQFCQEIYENVTRPSTMSSNANA